MIRKSPLPAWGIALCTATVLAQTRPSGQEASTAASAFAWVYASSYPRVKLRSTASPPHPVASSRQFPARRFAPGSAAWPFNGFAFLECSCQAAPASDVT